MIILKSPTLNELIDIVRNICDKHQMVNKFMYGPEWDANIGGNFTPFIYMEEIECSISVGNNKHKVATHQFSLYCLDRIDQTNNNYIDILSDSKYILDTILVELDQHPLFSELLITIDPSSDVSMEPIYEFLDDNFNGHRMVFNLKYPLTYTICNNPIGDITPGLVWELVDNNWEDENDFWEDV